MYENSKHLREPLSSLLNAPKNKIQLVLALVHLVLKSDGSEHVAQHYQVKCRVQHKSFDNCVVLTVNVIH